MTPLHPAFDWHNVAYLALASRTLDELEEIELAPQGHVKYQFSARGHELGQILISQLLDRPFDAAGVYYRSRPFALGSGLTIEEALAAGMARGEGISDGRDVGVVFNLPRRERVLILPMGGDVGSQFTPAVGWAQAIRYRVTHLGQTNLSDSIAVVFSGEGAVASNGFWSALTIATTLQLPLLFVVEDNGYAISVQSSMQTPGANIAANLASFANLTIWDGSGTDPAETAALTTAAVAHVRAGHGPGLLRLTVPRLCGHTGIDNQAYKTDSELAEERQRDPILALRSYLVPDLMSQPDWDELVEVVRQIVLEGRDAALNRPEPDPSTVCRHVWSEPNQPQTVGGLAAEGIKLPAGTPAPRPPSAQRINLLEAIRRTLDVELAANERCLVFGEDVGLKGGVHAATVGLQKKYGEGRVFDTSLSEEGIIGRAVGMALAGLMPVPEIQFRKYADPATEQLNNCGTIRWRTANRFAAPLVVRLPAGYRKVGDPWHSVTGEVVFAHAVGWKIAVPSNAEDAAGLLRTALRGNDPVIFFEHRALLDSVWARRPYPGDDYVLPFGRARCVTTGADLTVVTWGVMVEQCELAASRLEPAGAPGRIEIIDLRTLVPWDKTTVLDSVRKTSKCLIVHEDTGPAGFGAEIAATIARDAFLDLDGPIERVAAPPVPVPYNAGLMAAVVPNVDRICRRMEALLAF